MLDQLDVAITQLGLNAADVELVPAIPFKVFTGLLRAFQDDTGRMRLQGVASSTTRDLHGDTMLESALQDMEIAANGNLTIFLNHSYNVPEDVAGSVESAKMVRRGADGDGNPNYDLDMSSLINKANPRAVEAWQAIKDGTKLGLSIGALIPEGGAVRNKKDGTLTIAHVSLLETSIVGIPANPRSWISQAVKAFQSDMVSRAATVHQLGSPTLQLDGDRYLIEGSLNGLQHNWAPSTNSITTPVADDVSDTDKDVDPDVQDARIRIIEVDTDDGNTPPPADDSSQGAGDGEPEDEEWAAPTPDATAAGPASSDADQVAITAFQPALRTSVELLETTTRDLVVTRQQLSEAITARDAAIQERDRYVVSALQAIKLAATVIEKVGSTPLKRKASVVEATRDLSHLEAVYGADFLAVLRKSR